MTTHCPGPQTSLCTVCGKETATVSFVRDCKATPPRCLACIRKQSEANLAATTRPGKRIEPNGSTIFAAEVQA